MLLCIATALINQATTKKVPDRHRAVLQVCRFSLHARAGLQQRRPLQRHSMLRCCSHMVPMLLLLLFLRQAERRNMMHVARQRKAERREHTALICRAGLCCSKGLCTA